MITLPFAVSVMGQNTVLGTGPGTGGYNNTHIGQDAGRVSYAGDNTFVGHQTGYTNSSGSENTGIGWLSMYDNTTGFENTGTGGWSLTNNTTGYRNCAFGLSSLSENISGALNSAFGFQSMWTNSTGGGNTASGAFSLFGNSTGSYSSAFGYSALKNATGSYNNALGANALYDVTSGTYNTAIGYNSGKGITTGSNNTIIGANVTGLSSSLANNIIIADGAGNRRINVDNAGRVGIGTNSAHTSSVLDLTSTVGGFLMPRMTTTQRNSISTPATGLQVYNTTTNTVNYYDGSTWREMGIGNYWYDAAGDVYNTASYNKIHVGTQANSYNDNYKMSVETSNNNMGLYVFNQRANSIGTFSQGTRCGIYSSVGTYDLNNPTNRTVWTFNNNFFGGVFNSNGDNTNATNYGVYANATDYGSGNVYGTYSTGRGNDNNVYGVYGTVDNVGTGYGVVGEIPSWSSNTAAYGVKGVVNGMHTAIYGIYGDIAGLSSSMGTNPYWAGYFNGDVYTTGMYLPSDRKLKKDITPMDGVLERVMRLKPSNYSYDQDKYKGMNFESGNRYGFIADEFGSVFPEFVKKSIHPERKDSNGNVIAEAVDFTAVNYVELIPVLTKAIQEQQTQIETQNKLIDELKLEIGTVKSLNNSKVILDGSGNSQKVAINEAPILMQNHPNPLNGVTFIEYFIPENSGSAFLKVVDINGKLIQAFPINQKGYGQIEMDCSKLSAGTYTYSLLVDTKVIDSKKMVVNPGK